MKYIVIEARKPQDGSPARQALVMFPDWMSATLVCAGITGRIIEMTDGGIKESGALEITEQEVLTAALIGGFPSPTTSEQTPCDVTQQRDEAYREGMQAMRDTLMTALTDAGFVQPEGVKFVPWLLSQLQELAQFRINPPEFKGGASRQAYDETLAKLQAAEDNLDAWRDAAGDNPSIRQYFDTETGRLAKLSAAIDASESNRVAELTEEIDRLRTLLAGIRRMAKKGKA